MTTETSTSNRSYPLPYPSNLLAADVLRLRDALQAIDADMAARPVAATVTAEINAAIQALVAGAPGALDTLNELAAALGDDANFASTVTGQLALKANQTAVDDALALKANQTAVDDALALKANSADVYTKTEADNRYLQSVPDGSVTTPKLADDAVTRAKVGESLIRLGTQQATTSGTFKEFTNIPAWARRITVALNGLSTNGAANILVQLGTGGAPTTSGYTGNSVFSSWASGVVSISSAAGIPIFNNAATYSHFGHLTFTNVGGNSWVASGQLATGGTQGAIVSSGFIELSGVLDYLRIVTANGTDAFDAGAVNITWE